MDQMKMIRPVSDLRNHFKDITETVEKTNQPLFLTKNGYGSIVVLSMEAYEKNQYESEIYNKIRVAEINNRLNNKRYSADEILKSVEELLDQEDEIDGKL